MKNAPSLSRLLAQHPSDSDGFPCYCDHKTVCVLNKHATGMRASVREHKNSEATTQPNLNQHRASSAHPTQLSACWNLLFFSLVCYRCCFCGRSSCFCFVIPIVTHLDNKLANATCNWKCLRNQQPPLHRFSYSGRFIVSTNRRCAPPHVTEALFALLLTCALKQNYPLTLNFHELRMLFLCIFHRERCVRSRDVIEIFRSGYFDGFY